MTYSVNVRTIAETYYEGGDLIPASAALSRMQDGVKGHLMVQSGYTDGFEAEVPVKLRLEYRGLDLLIQGRIDGLALTRTRCCVEEIKIPAVPPSLVSENDWPVHWAQAEIYAYMALKSSALAEAEVRLKYSSLTGESRVFSRKYSFARLEELFFTYLDEYVSRLQRSDDYLKTALPSAKEVVFPFDDFRDGQMSFAEHAYNAIKGRTCLLAQAPTGIGKTAAALFPAVQALGEGLTDVVFYLTARSTGRIAAENCLRLMREKGLVLRSVSLYAKRKLCPTPALNCDPSECPLAKGYFDRQKYAVKESWSASSFGQEEIMALADRFDLCPFELSLALCETAQVIICDYNYVFDPAVRLRRFFDRACRFTLLVDEAHNLPSRVTEMHSAALSERQLSSFLKKLDPSVPVFLPVISAVNAVLALLPVPVPPEMSLEKPESLIFALKALGDELRSLLGTGLSIAEDVRQLYFDCLAFIRASDSFDPATHRLLSLSEGGAQQKIWLWQPTDAISRVLKKARGALLFSATLSPVEHYSYLMGLDMNRGDETLSLPSPFPRENLKSLCLDIPAVYSKRSESVPRVAQALKTLAESKVGNYIACFPSHAYLEAVYREFKFASPDIRAIKQSRDMNEAARKAFLDCFETAPETSLIGFIVLGGVFSEGIDLSGDRLIGAAIVGVGMPQICFERDCLKYLYDEKDENGFVTAYVYPGIGKCLQAAGRVIRSDTDKGVLLFIDERYSLPFFRRLLPGHLRPKRTKESALKGALSEFWTEE
ncbi:MAG: ATP-dependent DNA helicase [Clostridiales bacterium]|nr:ATP-dependent DNA helicase [Clostridiales bacterium]